MGTCRGRDGDNGRLRIAGQIDAIANAPILNGSKTRGGAVAAPRRSAALRFALQSQMDFGDGIPAVGTDEAGYAPNLGPLVITCTVWRVTAESPDMDLYQRLQAVVAAEKDGKSKVDPLLVADSKVALYSPARGLQALLERGVLAMLGLVDDVPRAIGAPPGNYSIAKRRAHLDGHLPWHRDYDSSLPHAADHDDVLEAAGRLRAGMAAAGVELVSLRSTAVFPQPFNDGADRWGNKAEALSRWTLALVADALESCQAEEVRVVCDKHGGRNRYGRLLQEHFPEHLIRSPPEEPGRGATYRWGPQGTANCTVRFCARRRVASMPVALASMTSKYLRELAMRAFNDYWCRRVPNSPSHGRGYPWRRLALQSREIASVQSSLGIDDRVLWRMPLV